MAKKTVDLSEKLLDAIYEEDVKKVSALITKGVDLSRQAANCLPLVEASCKSSTEVVAVLLKAGADVNQAQELFGHSPLTAACEAGNLETARLLVAHGADVNFVARGVTSPLAEAAGGKEKQPLLQFLLDAGADPKAVFHSKDGTPVSNVLMHACQFASPEIVELLIQAGAPVNQRLHFGTALIAAVEEGRGDNVRVLLKHGANPLHKAPDDPKLQDLCGRNAIELAVHLRKKQIVALLETRSKS
jgi:ankyrin repeat protein